MHEPDAFPGGDLLVILRHGPHGSSWLREGLDAALVAAAFGQRVTLLCLGDGVTALLAGQGSGPLGQKGTHTMLEMLPMYDIETLLVEADALRERGLSADDLLLPVQTVAGEALAALCGTHRLVLNF